MSDKEILQEIRENRINATTELDAIRSEAKKDRLCVAGKVWEAMDPDAVKERQDTKRPYLNADELGQYINQTVNGVRVNPRGIKYAPTGNGANDAGAEFYQNHTREIEYRSKASVVYAHAFEDCVTSSQGWLRIKTLREHPRSFNHNLVIDFIANADQVLADPGAVWPDSRDMKYLYFIEPWTRGEFSRRHPKAKAANFSFDDTKVAPGWMNRDRVDVGEYWKLETVTRKLVAYILKGGDPTTAQVSLLDELPDGKLPPGTENIREESVDDTTVKCWLTNGLEILKEQKWLGKYIPFVSCTGKVIYIDGQKTILSMTRLARDPAMFSAYVLTCTAEAIGGVPRNQWVGYEGQFAKPKRWEQANRQPVAFTEAKVTVPGNPTTTPLPLPQKQSWDPPIQNLEIVSESARRRIQAAMGISPQPTEAQRRNDASGVAYKERQSEGQRGSFHFVDSYDLMVERTGIILEDAIPHYLDAARDVPVRKPNDDADVIRINDPAGSRYDNQWQLSGDPIFTKGDYRVTVSTGPATDSQREEADAFVDALVSNIAAIAQLAGPQTALKLLAKSVKVKQLGPMGDEIIDLLDPPQMGQDGKPLPPEMAKLLSENKQLQQMLEQAKQEHQAKVVEQQGKMAIVQEQEKHEDMRAMVDRQVKLAVAALDREVKLAVAEMTAKRADVELFLEESRLAGARAHEARMAASDRVHDDVNQAKDRVHEHVQAELEHTRAKELADQAAAHASAAVDQQAMNQPAADAGA
jgi:hypothetical protein